MEFRIMIDDIRVLSIDGRLMAVINTTADEMETAVKDRPGTLTDRCKRLAEMVRETQTPEPADPPQYVHEPVYGPIQRRLDDGWPASVSETARRMFGGDK